MFLRKLPVVRPSWGTNIARVRGEQSVEKFSTYRTAMALTATLVLAACPGTAELPAEDPVADPQPPATAADRTSPEEAPFSADPWPTLESGLPCEVRWLSPDAGPRNGQTVDAVVEVPIAEGAEFVDLLARSYDAGIKDPDGLPATVEALDKPGTFAIAYPVPTDGGWRLCATCLQSDGQTGDLCVDGFTIDNVPPPPPVNFRRID